MHLGGEKQRVAIAGALGIILRFSQRRGDECADPRHEVGVDPFARRSEVGLTVVMVTHQWR